MENNSILHNLKLCKGKMISDVILPGWIESTGDVNVFVNSDFLIILSIDIYYYHFHMEDGIIKLFVKEYIDQVNVVDESDVRCIFESKDIFGIFNSVISDIIIYGLYEEGFCSVKFQLDDGDCIFIWSDSISMHVGRSKECNMWFRYQDSSQYKPTLL